MNGWWNGYLINFLVIKTRQGGRLNMEAASQFQGTQEQWDAITKQRGNEYWGQCFKNIRSTKRILWGKIKGEPLPPITIKIGEKPEKQPDFNDWARHIGREIDNLKRN